MNMIYTHADATGYERGDMGKGKPKSKLIYRVDLINEKNQTASTVSMTVWGDLIHERRPLHTLEELDKPIIR